MAKLEAFLCHSSGDKIAVRRLYQGLASEPFVQPWIDEENLLPGQDWELEIRGAVRESHVVIVCLSKESVTREGFSQKEIKMALDVADEKPQGTIFIIPVKLEECDVPERLRNLHSVNLFEDAGYEKLLRALRARAEDVGTPMPHNLTLSPSHAVPNQTITMIGKGYSPSGSAQINDGHDTSSILIDGDPTGLKASGVASATAKINEGWDIAIEGGGDWWATMVLPIDHSTLTPGPHEVNVTDNEGSEGNAVLTIAERALYLSPEESRAGSIITVIGSGYPAANNDIGAEATPSVLIKYTCGTTTDTVASITADGQGNISGIFTVPLFVDVPSTNIVTAELEFTPTGGTSTTLVTSATHVVLP